VGGLVWSHSSLVGVQAMDDQHGILMDTVNELRVRLLQGASREAIGTQLERLIEFTGMHFACEEKLLEVHGYPGLKAHRAEHQKLMREIRLALERTQHGQSGDLQPLLDFLRNWFTQHVEREDMFYGEWLNSRGIY
jgi:hemerythrin